MTCAAILVAAGRGVRAGGVTPKQFQTLAGRPMVAWSLDTLAGHPAIDRVVVVLPQDRADVALPPVAGADVIAVAGGPTRDASVRCGLAALDGDGMVLIHDAARPLLTPALIDRVIAALAEAPAAAPGVTITDALWRVDGGQVTGVVAREGLARAQTPQGFHLSAIRAAHATHAGPAADDVEVARAHGLDVAVVAGEEDNIKVTQPADFARAERRLQARKDVALDIRVGNGVDVHRFAPGNAVTLCGVAIPHDQGLDGHSDADVAMHALTDAIYGALADGDIGVHFPPSDPQWKGAASDIFLRHAVERAAERGYAIGNADCTIICERPKIGPHAAAMRAELARITGAAADRISVKATTSETLGFTGRGEGIAAMASVTLVSA